MLKFRQINVNLTFAQTSFLILLQVTIVMKYLLLVMVIIIARPSKQTSFKSVTELERNFREMMKTLLMRLLLVFPPSPPMQWLSSFAVAQVRGAGPTQPAAGRGQQEVGREI